MRIEDVEIEAAVSVENRAPSLAESIPCTNANKFTKFLKNKNKNGFRFTEIQEESVSQITNNLPNKISMALMEYPTNY